MPDELSVRLCNLVQQRPELYDILDERFHDETAKMSAWREVAYGLAVPQSECEIKWKKIRHQFVKAKKERDTTWDLWPHLRFLEEAESRSMPGKNLKKKKPGTMTADSPGTARRSTRKGRMSEASTMTADSPRVSSLYGSISGLTKSTLDEAICSKQVQPTTVHSHGLQSKCELGSVPLTPMSLKGGPFPSTPVLSQRHSHGLQSKCELGSVPLTPMSLKGGPFPSTPVLSQRFLTAAFSGKHEDSSEDSGPQCKRLRTDGSGVGAHSQQSKGPEWSAVLGENFLLQLENKFAKLSPEVRWTMKSTILQMLDEAA